MTERCRQTNELASAYLDNELSATESLALERHLRQCPDCASEISALAALCAQIKTHARYHSAQPALMDKVATASAPAASSQSPASFRKRGPLTSWMPMAGAAAMVLLLAAMGAWYFAGRKAETGLSNAILASHIRSTLSRQPFDVASSDRHTVKPWFSGKLDFAPTVIDLSVQGFVLLGGRLDFVEGKTVAVIVYARRKHVIDLYVWPNAGRADRSPRPAESQGYNLIDWQRGGLRYSAISDLAAAELMEFARQSASQAAREAPKPE